MGKSEQEFDDQMSELEKSFGPLGPGAKDTLLSQLSSLSTDDTRSRTDGRAASSASVLSEGSGIKLPSMKNGSEASVLNELSGVKVPSAKKKGPGLIEELSSSKDVEINGGKRKLREPEYSVEKDGEELVEALVVSIQLPGVTSVGECELDISEVRL